mmetsp:Transcript_14027/g.32611  ORF Transcript_14027/g.32611 Transcript_14027/m.32611 type:complete len:200 (+) Transcript_14027:556-1155(+)
MHLVLTAPDTMSADSSVSHRCQHQHQSLRLLYHAARLLDPRLEPRESLVHHNLCEPLLAQGVEHLLLHHPVMVCGCYQRHLSNYFQGDNSARAAAPTCGGPSCPERNPLVPPRQWRIFPTGPMRDLPSARSRPLVLDENPAICSASQSSDVEAFPSRCHSAARGRKFLSGLPRLRMMRSDRRRHRNCCLHLYRLTLSPW